jgi:ergothioneine biosynthesis protein EgtB
MRPNLTSQISEARANTDALFRIVHPQSLYDRPIAERHRIVFYIGHLEAFDFNLLASGLFQREPFHEEFDKLFAFGIDPVDGGLPKDQPGDWPPMREVIAYRERTRSIVDQCLTEALEGGAPKHPLPDANELDLRLNVAIEHRLMHAETLAYMLHQLPLDQKFEQQTPRSPAAPPVEPRMVEIPRGNATLGKPRTSQAGFGWDNEFEEQCVDVPAFRVDAFKVTNGQFLEFLRAGGYGDRSLWSDAAWEWKESEGIRHPSFWIPAGEGFLLKGMFAEHPLPMDWPVYVSHAEASAYARWAGKSLPTEAQWHRAAYGTPQGTERPYPWGEQAPSALHGNFDFHRWDPAPVNAHPAGKSAFGAYDLLGNGWEWTSTVFGPLPGFEPFPFYRGYSANFFDGKHFVMKGGAPRTAACMLRRTFRNWFQGHYPFVYAGFRCVENGA